MKKIAFVVPYFGSLPYYFQLWLKSCDCNKNIDWILITDLQLLNHSIPKNVRYIYCTWEKLVKRFQSHFDHKINLTNYYYLCNFKVSYGEIFKNELVGYDYWGYCDIDIIWGNLEKFISIPCALSYDKISWRGHMTLFKNLYCINGLYKNKIDGYLDFNTVASNQYGLNFHFDEREINIIFEKTNHRIYYDVPFAEVKIRKFSFELLHRDENEIHKNKDHFFIWKNGSLYRLYYDRIYKKVMAEEYAYFHFLKRKMKLLNGIEGAKQLLIVPNEIKPLNHLVPDMIFKKYSLNKIYISYYVERLNPDFIFNKIINVAKSYFFNLSSRVNANPHFSYKFNSHHVRISEIQKIQ